MKKKEVVLLIRELSKVFDVARLVDAEMTTQYTLDDFDNLIKGEHRCYTVWHKDSRCENCISSKALVHHSRITKCELRDDELYFVVSQYVDVEGVPYVLEVVSKITDESMFGAIGKENLIHGVVEYNHRIYKDALTGAYNREYYEEQIKMIVNASALAMVDIDDFKSINDTYGHKIGDRVLKNIAELFMKIIAKDDIVIRYGGDEFLLVFNGMPQYAFSQRLNELRKAVEQLSIEECPALHLTVSIGGSLATDDTENRLELADRRMYLAKITKNAVCTNN